MVLPSLMPLNTEKLLEHFSIAASPGPILPSLSINYISLCILLLPLIGLPLNVCSTTLKGQSTMACSSPKGLSPLMHFVTLIGLMAPTIAGLPLALEFFSSLVSSLGVPRRNPLLLGLARRLSTVPWQSPLLTCIGSGCYSKTFKFLCLPYLCYGVTMLALLLLPPIRSSMPAPNTLR